MNINPVTLSAFAVLLFGHSVYDSHNRLLTFRQHVPRIAELRAGEATEFDAQTIYGPGLRSTGDHSNSCLTWRSRANGSYLSVDGFYYGVEHGHQSYIIDYIRLSRDICAETPEEVPTVGFNPESCKLYGKFGIGSGDAALLSRLRRMGIAFHRRKPDITWSFKARVRTSTRPQVMFTDWQVDITLDGRNKISSIEETANGDYIR